MEEQKAFDVKFKNVTIKNIPHKWDCDQYTIPSSVESKCAEIFEHCIKNNESEFDYNNWEGG